MYMYMYMYMYTYVYTYISWLYLYTYIYTHVYIGRESADTEPLVDLFGRQVEHFIYMSSAGVYKKSLTMPHMEVDAVDPKSRHKGKLETEAMLRGTKNKNK
jgi:UDP-glucose 4-epimerase